MKRVSLASIIHSNCTIPEMYEWSTTPFEELPHTWKKFLKKKAKNVIKFMRAIGGKNAILELDLSDQSTRIKCGASLYRFEYIGIFYFYNHYLPNFKKLPNDMQDMYIQEVISLQQWLQSKMHRKNYFS